MTDWQFFVVAAVLSWIGYQLWALRIESRTRHLELLEQQERNELDDELKRQFPTIFDSSTRKELREWQEVRLRKHQYFEDRKNTLLNPHSDEPSSWLDMYMMLSGMAKPSDESDYDFPEALSEEERGYLEQCRTVTESFLTEAKEHTDLTGAELNFFAYQRWKQGFLERDRWRKPSKIDHDLFEMSFDTTLDIHRREPRNGTSS